MIGALSLSVSPTGLAQARRSGAPLLEAPLPSAAYTLWADISSYQGYVDFSKYPYRVLAIRSNDGTYDDPHFVQNLALSKQALDTAKLDMLGVYCVYRPNWQQTLANLEQNVGQPHPRMWFMVDVESWGGQIRGSQTAGIEAMRQALAQWVNARLGISNGSARVVVYGNANDLNALYPGRPSSVRIVLANYSSNPAFPGKWAHQFSSSYNVPPFGACDINSADGYTVPQLAASLGVNLSTTPYYKGHDNALVSTDGHWLMWLDNNGNLYRHKDGTDQGAVSVADLQALINVARANGTLK